MQADDLKQFTGGMDMNSAPELVALNDYLKAVNLRNTGTSEGEEGYNTNIEGTTLIPYTQRQGLNKCVGCNAFESIRQAVAFIYNSAGFHQILLYDYDTNIVTPIYTDKTNSGGISLLTLDPQEYVQIRLINDTFIAWVSGTSPVGFTNLISLKNGVYGTVTAEDFSLIKPQNLTPISAGYLSDTGKASNFVKGKLFQFTSQYVGMDYTYSAWGTWSKRIVPDQESTPTVGTDVTQNNCIKVSVNIGSERVQTINIAARYGTFDFNIIKSVDRSYVTGLTNTLIDISQEIYEAYDPTTNIYTFLFYNESINIPVAATETDQPYDYVPLYANAIERINNNIIALGGLGVGFDRPTTQATIKPIGYDPNITVPLNPNGNPVYVDYSFAGSSGSGLGNHKRLIIVQYGGSPQTGDVLTIVLADIRNAQNTLTYTYTVPSSQNGDLYNAVLSFGETIPGSSVYTAPGSVGIKIVGQPYFGLQSAPVTLYNAGATVSRSIHSFLDNSSYQAALSYRDQYGRFFPLCTDNSFIINTPSYAQLNGQALKLSWQLASAAAPEGAVDYQWLITENKTTDKILDVLGNVVNYIGSWNAGTNSPTLAPNAGTVGDAYQITTPSLSNSTINLGNGVQQYNTGDYVVFNGKSWDIVPKEFGDLTPSGNIIAIKINPLYLFNQKYTNAGANTVLTYSYSDGDRCTFHYYLTGSTPTYLNNPCIDIEVLGYNLGSYLVKVEKSSSIDMTTIAGKDVFLRLYSPKQQVQTASTSQNSTVWYEIGERFTITNGMHDVMSGMITDGDVYYKTRQYSGAVDPNSAYEVLATDFNFSDFYPSAFNSYGRPRSYYDELETTQLKASIIPSESYVVGSKNNGLTKFYKANLYGDGDGQTSSSFESIQILWQRNEYLIVIQELKVGYIPVNISIIEDNTEQQQVAISEKLFNNVRYNQSGNIGIGKAKESFCYYNNNGYFVDPNRSEPIRVGLDGVLPISGKMSKFFKATLQAAYASGKKIIGYYDAYYNEFVLSIEQAGGSFLTVTFDTSGWNIYDNYSIAGTDVTNITDGANTTHTYDSSTGEVTFNPSANFTGNNVATFSFNTTGGVVTKNLCLNWTAGNTNVNPFSFVDAVNQPLNTEIQSKTISVTGNDIAVPISIVGGQYSINGGTFTSIAGTVNPNDVVQVEVLSSSIYEVQTGCTLTISNQSASFHVTTMGTQNVNPFSFTDKNNQELSTEVTSDQITVSGNTSPAPISITGGEYSINGGVFTSTAGTVNAGDNVIVRVLTSSAYNTVTSCTLTISNQSATFNARTKISLADFDYMVLRYVWHTGSGVDLDTFTGFENTGTAYDGDPNSRTNWVGYNQNPTPPATTGTPPDNRIIPQGSATPYLNWGTDNTTGDGVEAILVDIKQFNTDFPAVANPVQVRMNAVWYQSLGTGSISVEVTTYKGGTMSLVGTDFVNSGGTQVDDITLPVTLTKQSTSSLIANSQDIAVMGYDKSTNTASLTLK